MNKFLRNYPTWVNAAYLMQQESDASLPMGDAAVNSFIEEAAGVNETQVTETEDAKLSIESYLVDMTKDIVPPEFRFKIVGVEFCPSGGITAVSGQAKQGKSQFLLVLAATLLSGRDFGTLQRMQPCQSLLWIDTEQSMYDVQSNIKRLYHLAGVPMGTDASTIGLHVAKLRDCNPEQRIAIIEDGINKFNPDIIVIDGVRDLLYNFNDERESGELVQRIMDWSAHLPQTNIFCVLHNNPNENKMRGHLGTELLNKCTDRFIVSKEDGFFRVKHESRHMELPEDFNFCIDGEGHLAPHKGFGGDDSQSVDILKRIFKDVEKGLPYEEIVAEFAKQGGMTTADARKRIKSCNAENGNQLLTKRSGKYVFNPAG